MVDAEKLLAELLEGSVDASEVWNGRVAARVLRDTYAKWLATLAPWSLFVTLTFREDRTEDVARGLFRRLVRVLNEEAFGKRYQRIVKHSYFSYVLAMEYQLREVVHLHFIADRPLHFRLLHDVWNVWAGFALTEIIRDPEGALKYVSKYVVKAEHPEIWVAKKQVMPVVMPSWWQESERSTGEGRGAGDPGRAGNGGGSTA